MSLARDRLFPALPLILILNLLFVLPAFSQPDSTTLGVTRVHKRADVKAAPVEDYRDLWKRGDYAGSLRALNEMIMTMSRGVPPRYLFDRAELHFSTGRLDFAIRDMEILCRQISAPVYTVRLAEYYRSVGKQKLFEQTLDEAARQAENRWFYGAYEENVLAMARIRELKGDNPRAILRTLLDPLIQRRPDYVGGYLGAGMLALRKGDKALASEYFGKALNLEPEHQAGLAGLIRCYFEAGDSRFIETLEQLRGINPHHPVIYELDAEGLLRKRADREALEVIEAGLKVNPTHSRLLALKSAALFSRDLIEEMEAHQKAALSINSHNSEIFRVTGELANLWYRFEESKNFLEQALVVDPNDHRAQAQLGFTLLDLGQDEEGRRRLEKAFDADPFNVPVFNMLKVLDTIETFETFERGDFRVTLPVDEAELLAEDALTLLEEAHEVLGSKYEVEYEPPIVVQIFSRHDDFMVRAIGNPSVVGFLGICTGKLITMDSPSARPPGEVNWHSVLWHEFAHVATLQKTRNRIPRWLSEGISMYEQGQRDSAWAQEASIEFKRIVSNHGLPRMEHLEGYFMMPPSGRHLNYAYFVSGEFVDFYVRKYGIDVLTSVLDSIANGEAAEEALLKNAAVSLDTLNLEFAEHMGRRFQKFENLPEIEEGGVRTVSISDGGTSVTLKRQQWASKSSPFTDAMSSGVRALEEEKWATAELHLRNAHELFPEYMGSDSPLRLLIQLYDKQDRREELSAALEEQVSIQETDLQAYLRLARLRADDGKWRQAGQLIDRAFGIDPFHVNARRMRKHAALMEGDVDTALLQLQHLIQLDPPYAADYRLERVWILIEAEHWDQAHDEAFALLEELPHFWGAQKALLRIIERDGGEVSAGNSGGSKGSTRREVAKS